jgi:hypothetical protein
MTMIVKVLDAISPNHGYMAEVPGQQGRFVKAATLTDLRTKLHAALADPEGSKFASSSWTTPGTGYSETSLFITL